MQDILKNTVEIEGFKCFSPEMAIENDGFDSKAFSFLMEKEDEYFWFKERNKIILWVMKSFFDSARSFLEIGCGTGYVSSAITKNFSNLEVYGSEIFVEGLKHASHRLKKDNLFQLDARQIPFDSIFDVIGMFDVLEHIDEDEKVLGEIYKALKPEGGVIITVPQHNFLWSKADEDACHKRRYSRKELHLKLKNAGFRVEYMTSFVSILMPLLLLSRVAAVKSKNYNPSEEFNLSPILNSIFGTTIKLERFLINKKISLPFGSSLLAIAYKV